MPSQDLHSKAFDEATILKLEIFEKYAQAWIPTFVHAHVKEISIFDFFAGTGYDIKGVPGSPIRILDKVKEHIGSIKKNEVKVNLYFNEYEPEKKQQIKYGQLDKACKEYLDINPELAAHVHIYITNKDFTEIFKERLSLINKQPSLVYIDQNGLKFLSDEYLLQLEKLTTVDFLYFASSSYLWRFGETNEIKSHILIDANQLKEKGYEFVHSSFTQQLRGRLPKNSNLKLYPFSIQKNQNIYGIIFGAKHPLAVNKFLEIIWSKNELNGEANFDIYNDAPKYEKQSAQMSLFAFEPEKVKRTKIEIFNDTVKLKILNKEITKNKELLQFAYAEGHLGKHASEAVKELKKEGKIIYNRKSPCVSYQKVFNEKDIVEYKLL